MSFNTNTDFNKISKYSIRMKKSFKNNDSDKVKEYYDHLKYHIQIGGNDIKTVEDKFKSLDDLIEKVSTNVTSNNYPTFTVLHEKLTKCNEEKTSLQTEIDTLKSEHEKLKTELKTNIETATKVSEIENTTAKDDEIKKLNSDILNLNNKITELGEQLEKIRNDNVIETDKKTSEIEKLNLMLEKIFQQAGITIEGIDNKNTELLDKIKKYQEIITEIKNQLNIIESDGDEKLTKALKELKTRLEACTVLQENFDVSEKQIKTLTEELEKIKNISDDLEAKEEQIKVLTKKNEEQDIQIKELNETIEEMKKEKETNNNQINKFVENFEEKLKTLLKSIYGDSATVDNILNGIKYSEK